MKTFGIIIMTLSLLCMQIDCSAISATYNTPLSMDSRRPYLDSELILSNVKTLTNIFTEFISIVKEGKFILNDTVVYSEDGRANFTELAEKYIGRTEEYDVITEDGYILKLFHIPGNCSKVVLFGHGGTVPADNYLIRGNTSLIYMIAEQGFDVWALDNRGSRYSRRHLTMDPESTKFWQFSMHEIGIYDYTAIIDFILYKTGQKELSVITHSLGTTAFFILLTERPEYNEKVKVFVALAPITYLRHSGATLRLLMTFSGILNPLLRMFHLEELGGYYSEEKKVFDSICSQGEAGYRFCFSVIGAITGFNPDNIEEEFMSTIIGHFPGGTNRKTINHYAIMYLFDDFVKYDYGLYNLFVYGSTTPPAYDLNQVTAKVALFAARKDGFTGVEDVERLRKNLKNVVHYQVISDDNFNHIDCIWGRNAHKVLYPYAIDILLKYS